MNPVARESFNPVLRVLLWVILLVETPIQLYLMSDWVTKWGFVDGILKWFESATLESIYAAAVLDFLCLILTIAVIFWIAERPMRSQKPLQFWALMGLIWLFPSLGVAVYLLFFRQYAPQAA